MSSLFSQTEQETLIKNLTAQQIEEELKRIVSCSYDRFKDSKMYTMRLNAHPLNCALNPEAHLVIFTDSTGEQTAGLRMIFQVKGNISVPAPGTSVDWLFKDERESSYVLVANGQSVSKNFRVGGDVIPGPLSLFVSAPVTFTKSSLWMTILITPEILKLLERFTGADLRINGLEFRLTSNSQIAPLSVFVSGITGYVNNDLNKALPLAQKIREKRLKEEAKHKRNIAITITIIIVAIIAWVWVMFRSTQEVAIPSVQNNIINSISPSPTSTPKKIKRKY